MEAYAYRHIHRTHGEAHDDLPRPKAFTSSSLLNNPESTLLRPRAMYVVNVWFASTTPRKVAPWLSTFRQASRESPSSVDYTPAVGSSDKRGSKPCLPKLAIIQAKERQPHHYYYYQYTPLGEHKKTVRSTCKCPNVPYISVHVGINS